MTSPPLLYQLLEKLSKPELREIKKLVRSPYVTHRQDIPLLFNTLADFCYQGKPLPGKELLFQTVFGNQPYDDQLLRSLMSDLHLIIEKYLTWNTATADEVSSHLALAGFYRQRNLPKHYSRTIKKADRKQSQQPYRNADFFQNQLKFQLETSKFQSTQQRTGHLNLQEIGDTMDVLYLAQKLRHVCSQLSHRAVYQTDYQFGLLQGWIDQLEDSSYLDIPAIALYYYCYRFLTEAYSQAYFRKFREHLLIHYAQFPQAELKDLYRAAINFCIRKLNEGSLEFTREGWELYQEGLLKGFFIENHQLSRFTFDNIVGFGLRLEEFLPVAQFIESYKSYLPEDYKESTVYFNLARLEYGQKNYDKALTHLQAANPKDLVNQLIAKTIQLKIYYEAGEFNLLESHLDSFRLFIRRREVSDYHRKNFQNIISYTRKLITSNPYDNQETEKVKEMILQEEILSERKWLLRKLEKM